MLSQSQKAGEWKSWRRTERAEECGALCGLELPCHMFLCVFSGRRKQHQVEIALKRKEKLFCGALKPCGSN